MAVIKVDNISKHFGALKAVDDLSFEVQAGQVFGFLGQNGSGKSTTIRMLLSLIHPSSGNIELFGKSIQKNRAPILEQVGAIIERPDLYPYLSATEHLQLFAKVRKQKVAASNITKTLEQVGLAHRAHDKVQSFSLGMKQRLGIAIALVHNPSLIILDEPTNGLDPQGIADIRALIQHLAKEEGKTVFVSSHLLSEIEQVANQILIIHQGKKMVEGLTKELLDPEKRVVQIKTMNDEQALATILSSSFSPYILPRKEGVFLKLPTQAIPLLNDTLVKAGILVIGIEAKNSLEDYFLQITSNA
ncbi:MAG: ABC transporter ATP-binding protein [Chitinophagaceae bacterium]|nr:MAG: ABC transporter ATP-binding protein [Chitinophagaceae bacterium]